MTMKEKIWRANANTVIQLYGGYVDWDEEFYICPGCGEPVYLCDWDEDALDEFICPICEDIDDEEEL